VTATLSPPPKKLGVAHWSSRLLAKHLGVSDATVTKASRERSDSWCDLARTPRRYASLRPE
jgi:hypothetical protein